MQIHCAPCTSSQIDTLKAAAVVPAFADQCGLITKSDAERLISYLNTPCLVDEGNEIRVEVDTLASLSPLCQRRHRATSSSTPSSPKSLPTEQEDTLGSEQFQRPSSADDCVKNIAPFKKIKEPFSESDNIEPNKNEKLVRSSVSPMCLEAIRSSAQQQMSMSTEEDREVMNIIAYRLIITILQI